MGGVFIVTKVAVTNIITVKGSRSNAEYVAMNLWGIRHSYEDLSPGSMYSVQRLAGRVLLEGKKEKNRV
jgi:hypothetical protein